ncbi:MAG: hypothetical protein ACK4FF_05395 [Limnobacter sp.]|uniref:hypothetical protein n=1 Tax=Limnobacter sp. TaxID=2003368 RepID=UPI0039189F67
MLYSPGTKGFYSEEIHGDNIPADAVEITTEEHSALLAAQSEGKVIKWDSKKKKPVAVDPPPPTREQVVQTYKAHIQHRLDDFCRTREYDGVLSCCTYVTSKVTKFRTEALYMLEKRDETWDIGTQILADVEAGTRPIPTLEELDAELPALAWPA